MRAVRILALSSLMGLVACAPEVQRLPPSPVGYYAPPVQPVASRPNDTGWMVRFCATAGDLAASTYDGKRNGMSWPHVRGLVLRNATVTGDALRLMLNIAEIGYFSRSRDEARRSVYEICARASERP